MLLPGPFSCAKGLDIVAGMPAPEKSSVPKQVIQAPKRSRMRLGDGCLQALRAGEAALQKARVAWRSKAYSSREFEAHLDPFMIYYDIKANKRQVDRCETECRIAHVEHSGAHAGGEHAAAPGEAQLSDARHGLRYSAWGQIRPWVVLNGTRWDLAEP